MRKFFIRKRSPNDSNQSLNLSNPSNSTSSSPIQSSSIPINPNTSSSSQHPSDSLTSHLQPSSTLLPPQPSDSLHNNSSSPSVPASGSAPTSSNTRPSPNQNLEQPIVRDQRDRRQVAFVSPESSDATQCVDSPSLPLPSQPTYRPSTGNSMGLSTNRATNYPATASSFHHPPASLTSPHRGTLAWRSESSTGSQSGSQLGHGAPMTSPEPITEHHHLGGAGTSASNCSHRPTSPISVLSSIYNGRRSSGGVVGPADTWGGNVIGGRLGEDIYQPMTWSEMNDLDLVENLSGRERTRQEVLWEIVASEERYVSELISLRNNYITPILYPMISPILLSSSSNNLDSSSCKSPITNLSSSTAPSPPAPAATGSDFLPIAARFIRSSTPTSNTSNSDLSRDHIPDIESEESHHQSPALSIPIDLQDQGNSNPTSDALVGTSTRNAFQRFGTRTRNALQITDAIAPGLRSSHPESTNLNQSNSSVSHAKNVISNLNQSNAIKGIRHYLRPPNPPNKLHKHHQTGDQSALMNHANFEFLLPESLKVVLNIINEGMFRGHQDLSVQLKERYLEQFPLVRDLTSVWAEQAWIIQSYGVYVTHLEKALREIEEALAIVGRKNSGASRTQKRLANIIMQLEENAMGQGECGLAICLSKPFQRLLKYPLLFQNLLYHTDGSTHEYESAQAMAISIDSIVRSIEDEKISEEERDKARDVWSRIDGINEKALMLPQSDRLLMSEESVWRPVPGKEKRTLSDAAEGARATTPVTSPTFKKEKSTSDRLRILKGQKSFRRLSDMVGSESKEPSLGSKRDIWLVIFSDVILRCQRVGVTRMATSYSSSLKDRLKGRRVLPGRERNLYKFLKIERWEKHPSIVLKEANATLDSEKAEVVSQKDRDHQSVWPSKAVTGAEYSDDSAEVLRGRIDNRTSVYSMDETDEYERMRRESAMSFCYELDDPKPVSSTVLKNTTNNIRSAISNASTPTLPRKFSPNPAPNTRILSPTTQSVIGKKTKAINKFSNRVPGGMPGAIAASNLLSQAATAGPLSMNSPGAPSQTQYRYEIPTMSTLAKKAHQSNVLGSSTRAISPSSKSRPPVVRRRAGSGSAQNSEAVVVSGNETFKGRSSVNRHRSDSTGAAPSPPGQKGHKVGNSTSSSNSNSRSKAKSSTIATKTNVTTISRQPSEDFSAFKSYFDTPISSRVIAFPTS
ncbi:hypothetical protein PPACK8108_LOCUS5870 [Phakopsora pachyrhizi]|uniref:DH domain-containing protein n=1 Tax=Phakopsora pachyrhizi TaxID=170000 RepID=A0AAV0ASJ4_PHAPC|nr:hypothetical protein PPACK8108_LOCUS5870 [Phakopsora pachyrhizi]